MKGNRSFVEGTSGPRDLGKLENVSQLGSTKKGCREGFFTKESTKGGKHQNGPRESRFGFGRRGKRKMHVLHVIVTRV